MLKFRTLINNFFGRIRYLIAKSRLWFLDVCRLAPAHWKWAAFAILLIIALFMVGLAVEFIGKLHIGIYLAALLFYPGLALLAGFGVRLAIKVLRLLPEKQNWIFFGALFFIFSFFSLPEKASVALVILLLLAGSFMGAGIYNLRGKRWKALSRIRKVLTVVFTFLGTGIFLFGLVYLLYPGKPADEVKVWSMEATQLPKQLSLDDPSLPGPFSIDSLTYGWGRDKPRKEFGSRAELKTMPVDGSNFLDGWSKLSGKLRTHYWKMGPDSLALNGRVWFPVGTGPFPLVLMVHGNHLDRDFSDPGYAYLGRHFASHGFISVSVDENFLNGAWSDFISGLETENDCRGWLLLKHLEQWREWNACDSALFYGKVDLDRVVLIGHSRGGEAVSVASSFNHLPVYPDNGKEVFDFNFGIRGVGAIAPVDGQYWPAGIATPVEDVNYFTIHGSMDADMRSYDGLRQMRRVKFRDTLYHFAAGLYVHGANHGQFNSSWGIYDYGYPNNLLLNRKAIIPVAQQERIALVYLTAFVMESCYPGSGYLSLFKDYRHGRMWLPDLVHLNQFHESSATILCEYEEDLDLHTGTSGIDSIAASGLALWKEGRIPKKWGDYRNNGVFLGWNNEKDSVPGTYTIYLDSSKVRSMEGSLELTFLAADAQMDPGDRKEEADTSEAEDAKKSNAGDSSRDKKGRKRNKDQEAKIADESDKSDKNGVGPDEDGDEDGDKDGDKDGDVSDDPVPVDFSIVLTDTAGMEYMVKLQDFQYLQPAIKPQVLKSKLFWNDAESEVILQYVSLPLAYFRNCEGASVTAGVIHSISFVFDSEEKGTVIIDQLGFSR